MVRRVTGKEKLREVPILLCEADYQMCGGILAKTAILKFEIARTRTVPRKVLVTRE
jgi:hypothetical protein